MVMSLFFFFFQAKDGILDTSVTGVQTCAFLFSSRRRHTRYIGDWSSDVCSSDLKGLFIIFTIRCIKGNIMVAQARLHFQHGFGFDAQCFSDILNFLMAEPA